MSKDNIIESLIVNLVKLSEQGDQENQTQKTVREELLELHEIAIRLNLNEAADIIKKAILEG